MKKIFIHILLFACCFTITTCQPEFTMDDVLFTIEAQPNDSTLGSVTGSGKYHYNDEITIEAKPITNYEFIAWSDGNTDNPRELLITSDTTFTATFHSIPQYTITVLSNDENMGTVSGGGTYNRDTKILLHATAKNGYIFTGWSDGDRDRDNPRTLVVTENVILTALFGEIDVNGYEYVDLGLPSATVWATCNVGATNPEDYGDYFAWGETTAKSTSYDWITYKYCNGSSSTLTKYCTSSKYGNNDFMDNKTVLEASDDAATANWGGDWRMPTKAEQQELLDECTWEWRSLNGVSGYRITGKKNKSIFLPAAGCRYDTSLSNAGEYGYYWSSSLSEKPTAAYNCLFYCYYYEYYNSYKYRSYGYSVRPVCSPQ